MLPWKLGRNYRPRGIYIISILLYLDFLCFFYFLLQIFHVFFFNVLFHVFFYFSLCFFYFSLSVFFCFLDFLSLCFMFFFVFCTFNFMFSLFLFSCFMFCLLYSCLYVFSTFVLMFYVFSTFWSTFCSHCCCRDRWRLQFSGISTVVFHNVKLCSQISITQIRFSQSELLLFTLVCPGV